MPDSQRDPQNSIYKYIEKYRVNQLHKLVLCSDHTTVFTAVDIFEFYLDLNIALARYVNQR